MSGPVLETLLQAAFGAAERIRRETPVTEQPASMAAAALRMAERLHGDLARCRVLLIGLGEMGELLAGELQQAGVAELVLIHRSSARAEISARRLGCHFRAWEEIPAALEQADILLSDQGSGRWTVTRDQIAQALRARRRRPMFVIDLAVPRDIEDSTNELPDAFVYNLDDLETLALEGRADGAAPSQQAAAILKRIACAAIRLAVKHAPISHPPGKGNLAVAGTFQRSGQNDRTSIQATKLRKNS